MTQTVNIAGFGCKATIQTKGAQIISFVDETGREHIWQRDPAVWPNCTPIMFPVCGAVWNDAICVGGKTYPHMKHGFSRVSEFAVGKVGEDFVEMVLEANEETKAMYPFAFVLHVTYTIVPGGYTTTLLVENKSTGEMPFCIGGHPGFICPMEEGASFTDYLLVFEQEEEGRTSLAPGGGLIDGSEIVPDFIDGKTLPVGHHLFDERDALIFAGLRSRSVRLIHKTSGKGLRFDFPKFENLAVWSAPKKNADYLCLEPWHGLPDAVTESGKFEDKANVTILQPGTCYKAAFTMTLI